MRFDAKETAERLRGASADGCVNKSIIAAFLGDLPVEERRSWKCPACGRMALDVIADALDPRDTRERIDEDVRKSSHEYWGCIGRACDDCPSMIDGERPYQRYGLHPYDCHRAQTLDLLRRQRELDGRAVKRWERSRAKLLAEMQADPGDRCHGTKTGYAYGCRCDECREAHREASREERRLRPGREEESAGKGREEPREAARGPKAHPKDVCTVPEYLKPLMGRPSLDRADGRCVWCGAPATDRHHIVKRSQGKWVRDGMEVRKPTVRLCGSGNASGCHGKAHAGLLHFRWVQATYDKRRPLQETAPGLPGHWEGLETKEPCDTLTAWGKTRGWRKL